MNSILKKPSTTLAPKAFSRNASMINSFNKAGIRATEGTLRLEVSLDSSAGYTFQVNANQTQLISEKRLRSGDAFVPTALGFFVKKAGSSTTPTNAEIAIGIPRTYPNSTIFTGSGEAANLEVLYQSYLQFQVNSVNVTETLDTLRFRRVGQAQQGVQASQQAAAVGTNGAYVRDEWDNSDYGFQTFHQSLCFNGQANNQINLLTPTSVNCAGTSSVNYAVIIMRGVLLINGANQVNDASLKAFVR
jgi:hypothetical protein